VLIGTSRVSAATSLSVSARGNQMARPEKVAVVDEIRTKLAEADATVLTEYRGLTVHELADLRGSLRGSGTEYKVFKNTLARRAIEGAGYDEITSMFEGPVALAFVRGDAAAAAKALRDFGRDNPALVVKGGLLGERVITPSEIAALAELPSRDVMLGQIAGMFQAPLTKAAGLFQAFTRNFAYGVQALIDERVAAGEVLPAATEPEAPAAEATEVEAPAAEAPAAEAPDTEAPVTEAPVTEAPDTEAPAADAAAPDAAPESTESE
jgi:large subunit ribosomal protein L10